jgi:hypothetical protein
LNDRIEGLLASIDGLQFTIIVERKSPFEKVPAKYGRCIDARIHADFQTVIAAIPSSPALLNENSNPKVPAKASPVGHRRQGIDFGICQAFGASQLPRHPRAKLRCRLPQIPVRVDAKRVVGSKRYSLPIGCHRDRSKKTPDASCINISVRMADKAADSSAQICMAATNDHRCL